MCCRVVRPTVDHLMSKMKKPAVAASFSLRQLPCGCHPAGMVDNKRDTTTGKRASFLSACHLLQLCFHITVGTLLYLLNNIFFLILIFIITVANKLRKLRKLSPQIRRDMFGVFFMYFNVVTLLTSTML